ncbi:hypothetical protein KSP39_PZI016574 [Platanthera zijinensis]|uniref:Uncharacterized protein n=1 Tax=Platanthera zijinensis TaxID=2320716 RepID=A0AAP0G0U9_9ASPA
MEQRFKTNLAEMEHWCSPGYSNLLPRKFGNVLALLPKVKGNEDSWCLTIQKILIAINSILTDVFQGFEEEKKFAEIMKMIVPSGKIPPPPLGGETLPEEVVIPIHSLLATVRRVLQVDGSFNEALFLLTTSMHHELLCAELPTLHVSSLDLLIAIIKSLRRLNSLRNGTFSTGNSCHTVSILRGFSLNIPESQIAFHKDKSILYNTYVTDLYGCCHLPYRATFQKNHRRKRKHGSLMSLECHNGDDIRIKNGSNKQQTPLSVQIAALKALEALLTVVIYTPGIEGSHGQGSVLSSQPSSPPPATSSRPVTTCRSTSSVVTTSFALTIDALQRPERQFIQQSLWSYPSASMPHSNDQSNSSHIHPPSTLCYLDSSASPGPSASPWCNLFSNVEYASLFRGSFLHLHGIRPYNLQHDPQIDSSDNVSMPPARVSITRLRQHLLLLFSPSPSPQQQFFILFKLPRRAAALLL